MDDLNGGFNRTEGDPWSGIGSNWEQECIQQIEDSPDIQTQLDGETNVSSQKLWVSFQSAACCIAQLYKDRHQGVSLWVPFQNAASSVTSLYRDCSESQKRFADLGFQSGYQRRNKELLAWAKRRKHSIKREDLIAFLSGKNSNSYYHHHHSRTASGWTGPRQRLILPDSMTAGGGGIRSPQHSITLTKLNISDSPSSSANLVNSEEGDLQTFREALALSVVGIRNSPQHSGYSNTTQPKRNTCNRVISGPNSSLAELNDFITEEFTRHVESRKRSASSTDVVMDSPTHKRSKFI